MKRSWQPAWCCWPAGGDQRSAAKPLWGCRNGISSLISQAHQWAGRALEPTPAIVQPERSDGAGDGADFLSKAPWAQWESGSKTAGSRSAAATLVGQQWAAADTDLTHARLLRACLEPWAFGELCAVALLRVSNSRPQVCGSTNSSSKAGDAWSLAEPVLRAIARQHGSREPACWRCRVRTARSAPGRGDGEPSSSMVSPGLFWSISPRCPSRPKPVMSVQA